MNNLPDSTFAGCGKTGCTNTEEGNKCEGLYCSSNDDCSSKCCLNTIVGACTFDYGQCIDDENSCPTIPTPTPTPDDPSPSGKDGDAGSSFPWLWIVISGVVVLAVLLVLCLVRRKRKK